MNERLQLFPDTVAITPTAGGEALALANCDLAALADRYGTPLYLYDRKTLDGAVEAYHSVLAASYPGEAGLTYAGKAFLCTAIAQWAAQQGLWVDCTGLGELTIAVAAGVPRGQILVHGVNKSPADLAAAVEHAGVIVVDNLVELNRLVALWREGPTAFPDLWLRLRPGLAVETHHAHTQTGQDVSKFGMNPKEIVRAAHLCRRQNLPLQGLHFHQGSHFHDPEPLGPGSGDGAGPDGRDRGRGRMVPVARRRLGCGLPRRRSAPTLDPGICPHYLVEKPVPGCRERDLPFPRLQLEPGRSLVARAGVALYRVGASKESAGRRWLLLDGGMTDNPRPALYGARYSALPVQEPQRPRSDRRGWPAPIVKAATC